MGKNEQNEGLLLEYIKKLINQEFKNINNVIGDFLMLVELSNAQNIDGKYLLRLQNLVDASAETADEIIHNNKMRTIDEITNLVVRLLTDIDSKQK